MLVATYMREAAQLDEIWFIISPQNPFKINAELADENHRLEMAKLSTEDVDYFKVSDIEFHLPKPSYTHLTLKELIKQFPQNKFHLIIGEDNVAKFHEWKEAEWITDNFHILVYNRTHQNNITEHSKFEIQNLPLIDISSTEIRKRVKQNLPIKYFVTEKTQLYMLNNKLYI